MKGSTVVGVVLQVVGIILAFIGGGWMVGVAITLCLLGTHVTLITMAFEVMKGVVEGIFGEMGGDDSK